MIPAHEINKEVEKTEMIKPVSFVIATVMTLASVAFLAGSSTESAGLDADFQEREETNFTYQLPPGASVEVSSIRGPVEISNSNSATAEVQIIRTARTRADLEYHKVEVNQIGNSLVVRGIEEQDRRSQNIRVNHHIKIKLPRNIQLGVNSISGWLRVGDTDGQTKVSSISGSATFGNVGGPLHVSSISGNLEVGNVGADVRASSISGDFRVGQLNGSLDVKSVSGSVKATVNELATQGIRIKSVSGSVEIGLKGDVNADFDARSFSGQVYLDLPGVIRESEMDSSHVRARIGMGGSPITVFSVSGNIRLSRS